ncbi:MAG: hypothetical protein NVS2B16_25650 [Chloroflexota bacterium]
MYTVAAQSLEYVRVAVATSLSGASVNPTGDVVQMAFTVPGTSPIASDWKTASWEIDATTTPSTYYARALVGPGAGVITLTPGTWDAWIKIVDNPEIPAKHSGPIQVI